MKKMYGYARVSTKEQHLDRQIKALLDHGIDDRDIVTDHASGASLERPGYTALKGTMLRDGDTLVVKSLDRLSRNKEHIIQELQYFKSRHITVQVIDLPTTMIDLPEGQRWVFDMINNIPKSHCNTRFAIHFIFGGPLFHHFGRLRLIYAV
ncbi:recombinase family protein [Subdoligranulum variabile]|uniref:recombinase family protein n=1 Tax=Subdoligranulum variabile TaxID=214851 RepID=UPI002942E7B2|nr:recombinase family protein [Subdoligranulum variabile]